MTKALQILSGFRSLSKTTLSLFLSPYTHGRKRDTPKRYDRHDCRYPKLNHSMNAQVVSHLVDLFCTFGSPLYRLKLRMIQLKQKRMTWMTKLRYACFSFQVLRISWSASQKCGIFPLKVIIVGLSKWKFFLVTEEEEDKEGCWEILGLGAYEWDTTYLGKDCPM